MNTKTLVFNKYKMKNIKLISILLIVLVICSCSNNVHEIPLEKKSLINENDRLIFSNESNELDTFYVIYYVFSAYSTYNTASGRLYENENIIVSNSSNKADNDTTILNFNYSKQMNTQNSSVRMANMLPALISINNQWYVDTQHAIDSLETYNIADIEYSNVFIFEKAEVDTTLSVNKFNYQHQYGIISYELRNGEKWKLIKYDSFDD